MASIKHIEGRSIHQIQSGQVIVDLCSVVKELVENSLDAGATSIDVRFKDNGLESIEVQDNGGGISSDDYETISLKHYTSKLSSYDDLSSLNTFGFRGEALSSLCALSRFHIITAQSDEAPKGTRLDFEVSGTLKGTTVAASQKGTTVAVEELFYTLPVRRKELEKNIKREYKKVLDILHAYACISTGVRLSVTHQPAKGKKATVFSTKASPNTKENIANIYGAKTLTALIPLDLKLELQSTTSQVLKDLDPLTNEVSTGVTIVGHVSRPVFGEGRSTPDRQMFFVNNRPCLLPQIAKAFNEVYRSYNITQSPFVFANLMLDTNAYDVNVSPDKRTILLHDQNDLLEALKEALINLFEAQEQTVPHSQLQTTTLPGYRPLTVSKDTVDRAFPVPEARHAEATEVSLKHFPSSPIAARSTAVSIEAASTSSEVGEPGGLLAKFMDRNLQERVVEAPRTAGQHEAKEPSRDKIRMAKRLQAYDDVSEENIDAESNDSSHVPGIQPGPIARPVLDFNARLLSQQNNSKQSDTMTDEAAVDATQHTEELLFGPRPAENSVNGSTASEGNSAMHLGYKRAIAEVATSPAATMAAKTGTAVSNDKKRKLRATTEERHRSQSSQFTQRMQSFAAAGSQMSVPPPRHGEFDESGRADGSDRVVFDEHSGAPDDDLSDEDVLGAEIEKAYQSEDANPDDNQDSDDGYVDEDARRQRDEAQVEAMVKQAEQAAAQPTQEQQKRAAGMMKANIRKDSTIRLVQRLEISSKRVEEQLRRFADAMDDFRRTQMQGSASDHLPPSSNTSPEERLSLTIAKSDFAKMRVIGQFNLGFILATRPATATGKIGPQSDELFIIDQHASDEIFNFSRLSLSTTLTPQPLVRPHALELTAIEEETILSHTDTLAKNGFTISMDESGDLPVGQRCHLLTLPTSRETVFDTRDLEELIALLGEATVAAGEVLRPSKVRKMLAMRACRSSIMIGRTLTQTSMGNVVRHMGEIDKPWNCPHGRPTMRHLASLGQWGGWQEGDGLVDDDEDEDDYGGIVPRGWADYIESRRAEDTGYESLPEV